MAAELSTKLRLNELEKPASDKWFKICPIKMDPLPEKNCTVLVSNGEGAESPWSFSRWVTFKISNSALWKFPTSYAVADGSPLSMVLLAF